jgi:hypothetical protein|tara:strand:+ start:1317 stop:1526 length:210 start_codon:yes stop_codon:yes gene_type:complete
MSNVVFGDEYSGVDQDNGIFGRGSAMMFSPGESELPSVQRGGNPMEEGNKNKVQISVDIAHVQQQMEDS